MGKQADAAVLIVFVLQVLQGPAGAQGPVGPQGPCCSSSSTSNIANLYSLLDQSILPGNPVLFENMNAIVMANYDTSLAATTGEITFLVGGIYKLAWYVAGQLTPPFPDPVPARSLSLYRNGSAIPGACFSSFTLFPDQLTTTAGGRLLSLLPLEM